MKTRVEIRESSIHGLGVFAIEDIKKGDVVGVLTGTVCEEPDPHSEYVCALEDWEGHYYYIEPFTPFKYLNHSQEANTDWDTPVLLALKNIKAGEEITIDYGEEFEDVIHAGPEDNLSVLGDTSESSGFPDEESGG